MCLMLQNVQDYQGVRALAAELGVESTLDPTITPMMDGDRSVLSLGIDRDTMREVFRDSSPGRECRRILRNSGRGGPGHTGRTLPCSASHTTCYVSPYGDVFPCVQFPLPTGNVRKQQLHRHLATLGADE